MLIGDALTASARRFPNKVALVDESGGGAYSKLETAANNLARCLVELGLVEGSNAGIFARNSIDYAVAYFGMAKAGCVSVNVPWKASPGEFEQLITRCDARLLIVGDEQLPKIRDRLTNLPNLEKIVVINRDPKRSGLRAGELDFRDWLGTGVSKFSKSRLTSSTPLAICFSGGTTGMPKAILSQHLSCSTRAMIGAVEFGDDENEVIALTPPLSYSNNQVRLLGGIMLGATVVLMGSWSASKFLDFVNKYNVTSAVLVPTQIGDLLADPNFKPRDTGTLKKFQYGAAPMPDSFVAALQRDFPHIELTEFYGLTETGYLTIKRPFHLRSKSACTGRVTFGLEVAIFDSGGNELPLGATGEIVARGDHLVPHYYGDQAMTTALLKYGGGWIATGDLGVLDEDGFLTIVGRIKELINSGGEKIAPAEVENALLRHPDVAECAVIGIPDKRRGEVPGAYVVLAPDATAGEAELIDFRCQEIDRYKRPREIQFIATLPRTSAGKIDKPALQAGAESAAAGGGEDRPKIGVFSA